MGGVNGMLLRIWAVIPFEFLMGSSSLEIRSFHRLKDVLAQTAAPLERDTTGAPTSREKKNLIVHKTLIHRQLKSNRSAPRRTGT